MNLKIDEKTGLIPAIIQDSETDKVLMLGYMSRESLEITEKTGLVTFYSRSRKEIWQKGETSGNTLAVVSMKEDCDGDTLLIKAKPAGPICHTGSDTCFEERNTNPYAILAKLERIINQRNKERPDGSYVTTLFESGIEKIAQKVGEEGVETVIAGLKQSDDDLKNESADLIFHLVILLEMRSISFKDVLDVLKKRNG